MGPFTWWHDKRAPSARLVTALHVNCLWLYTGFNPTSCCYEERAQGARCDFKWGLSWWHDKRAPSARLVRRAPGAQPVLKSSIGWSETPGHALHHTAFTLCQPSMAVYRISCFHDPRAVDVYVLLPLPLRQMHIWFFIYIYIYIYGYSIVKSFLRRFTRVVHVSKELCTFHKSCARFMEVVHVSHAP